MEEQLGRYLEPHEVVHHIDCDPQNNDPENLVLCPSNSEHNLAHASINPCIAPLLKAGVIRFNRETLRYETVPGS